VGPGDLSRGGGWPLKMKVNFILFAKGIYPDDDERVVIFVVVFIFFVLTSSFNARY
jgi:hypothetical protein